MLDGAHQRGGADAADVLDVTRALDPHLAAGVDHQFGDGRVVQPTFQPTQR
jgi:hypothetical protein